MSLYNMCEFMDRLMPHNFGHDTSKNHEKAVAKHNASIIGKISSIQHQFHNL